VILVDFNSLFFSNVLVAHAQKVLIDEDFLRHMILNGLRAHRTRFRSEFGELVLCVDSGNYWRKDIFPYYKAMRASAREQSPINWPEVFSHIDKIRLEIKTVFPYRYVRVDKAEADDIIAVLVEDHTEENFIGTKKSTVPILILSSDKDFIQLHCQGIKQYDPIHKKYVSHPNPAEYLVEHIIKGDAGDGVPNIRSPDNCFVNKIRQSPVRSTMFKDIDSFAKPEHPLYRNYMRNKQLVDLSMIPEKIKTAIREEYNSTEEGNRSQLFNYFMSNRLKYLMQHISEF